jgi:hypothetical protein
MRIAILIFFFLIGNLSFCQISNKGKQSQIDSLKTELEKEFKINERKNHLLNARLDSLEVRLVESIFIEEKAKNRNKYYNLFISISSVLIALGLLITNIINNQRNRKFLTKQTDYQKKLNKAQIRPIVHAYKNGGKELTELVLINYGGGAAVLEEISFIKNLNQDNEVRCRTISDLIDLTKFDDKISWDKKWNFTQNAYYLHPQQKTSLYKISAERLVKKYSYQQEDAEKLIEKIREERKDITLFIRYQDVLSIDSPEDSQPNEYFLDLYAG